MIYAFGFNTPPSLQYLRRIPCQLPDATFHVKLDMQVMAAPREDTPPLQAITA